MDGSHETTLRLLFSTDGSCCQSLGTLIAKKTTANNVTSTSPIQAASSKPVRNTRRVLLISPDRALHATLGGVLEANGFRVELVARLGEAERRVTILGPDLVLVDLEPALSANLRDECQKLLRRIQASNHAVVVIVLTEPDRFELAAEIVSQGASDFLTKPFAPQDLVRRMELALRLSMASGEGRAGGQTATSPPRLPITRSRASLGPAQPPETAAELLPADLILGRTSAIENVIEQVKLVAPKNTTVLITGETGTGKERVARAIHACGDRHNRAMVSVNCGGIPANLLEDEFFGHMKGAFTDAYQTRVGRFEQAHRGTIFLDEVGDLPLELQPKLLRALQEREIHRIGGIETVRFDARVVAATNMNLRRRVAEGRFREDLFYRINVFPVHLPPLRQRRQDIPLFVDHFFERFCRRDGLPRKKLHPSAEANLMARQWPGNIRELENAIEIAVIRSQERRVVEAFDFPEPEGPASLAAEVPSLFGEQTHDFKQLVSQFEQDLIHRVLESTNGNKSKAAEMLRIKRTTLIEKLKRFTYPPVFA